MKAVTLVIWALVTCVSGDTYAEIYSHLKDMEGFCLLGYIPTAGSGITLATGVDLGQWNVKEWNKMGVPAEITKELGPYMIYHTKAEAQKAGINPKSARLNLTEAAVLDRVFLQLGIDKMDEYFGKMTDKGKAALVSIRHWAGSLKSSTETKLTRMVNGKLVSYVWDAVRFKNATDSALTKAFLETQKTYSQGKTGYTRLGLEAAYVSGSHKTPSRDRCEPWCSKDPDYCLPTRT